MLRPFALDGEMVYCWLKSSLSGVPLTVILADSMPGIPRTVCSIWAVKRGSSQTPPTAMSPLMTTVAALPSRLTESTASSDW